MACFSSLKMTLKSLFSRPATRRYPFEKRETFKNTHGHIENDLVNCTYCTLCGKKCPTNAITVTRDPKHWEVDQLKCINCNICADVCPKDTITMHGSYSEPQTEKTEKQKQRK